MLRFLMGLAECGNYTAGIKALAGLFPAATRSRAGGFFNAGAQFGSVIAPPLILVLLINTFHVSWQWGFVIPAVLGSLWLIPWLSIFPSKERMTAIALKPAATAAGARGGLVHRFAATPDQQQGARAVPRPRVHRPDHDLLLDLAAAAISAHLMLGGRGMSFLAIGIFAAVPNLIGMGGNVIGGIVTDRLVKATGSVDKGRKIAFTCAFGLGALSMAMPWVTNDYIAVVLMGLALFGNQWVAAVYIGTVGDVVPQHLAGRVAGINGFGDNGTSMLAVLLTGAIIERYGWSQCSSAPGRCRCWHCSACSWCWKSSRRGSRAPRSAPDSDDDDRDAAAMKLETPASRAGVTISAEARARRARLGAAQRGQPRGAARRRGWSSSPGHRRGAGDRRRQGAARDTSRGTIPVGGQ